MACNANHKMKEKVYPKVKLSVADDSISFWQHWHIYGTYPTMIMDITILNRPGQFKKLPKTHSDKDKL